MKRCFVLDGTSYPPGIYSQPLYRQVEFFYVLTAQKLPGFPFQNNFLTFQNIGPVADFQGELHALLDQEDGHPAAVDFFHRLESPDDQLGLKAKGWFIQQQKC